MRVVLSLGIAVPVLLGACGPGGDDAGDGGAATRIVVTTNILGDVVEQVVGEGVEVSIVMPIGADPHDFSPSARQVEAMADADLLVVNGAGFEEGLEAAIEAAEGEGAEVFTFVDHVDLLDGDPHLWTDPTRVADGVAALGRRLDELGIAHDAGAYAEELRALDAEVASILSAVPPDQRVLVTNHEVLAYFADRYGFEVVGTVIPSPTTGAQPSAADVEDLAEVIRGEGVRAVFAETTASAAVAEALAESVGDVRIVTLFTESLGGPGSDVETYVDLVRTNARLIHDALVGTAPG